MDGVFLNQVYNLPSVRPHVECITQLNLQADKKAVSSNKHFNLLALQLLEPNYQQLLPIWEIYLRQGDTLVSNQQTIQGLYKKFLFLIPLYLFKINLR